MVTHTKTSPKMVNPKDIAGECRGGGKRRKGNETVHGVKFSVVERERGRQTDRHRQKQTQTNKHRQKRQRKREGSRGGGKEMKLYMV